MIVERIILNIIILYEVFHVCVLQLFVVADYREHSIWWNTVCMWTLLIKAFARALQDSEGNMIQKRHYIQSTPILGFNQK